MYDTNKNIDENDTNMRIQQASYTNLKKVSYRPTPFFNTYTVIIIQYLFTAESYFDSRIASLFFFILFLWFFLEETLGDIYGKREVSSDFRLQTSHFEVQTSDFGIVISGFSPSLVLVFSHQTEDTSCFPQDPQSLCNYVGLVNFSKKQLHIVLKIFYAYYIFV